MEVLDHRSNISNSSNINNTGNWGHQNRCYSSVSLASAATSEDNYSLAESFHTCCDDPAEDPQEKDGFTSTMSARVVSFSCLEDVMEEDHVTSSSAAAVTSMDKNVPHRTYLPGPNIVPLRSYSQLQQQPLSPRLTAARLALSSDIGLLRRSISSSHDSDTLGQDASDSPVKKMAKVLIDRDQLMASAAIPMSRSFATPRMAIGTAFRTSLGGSTNSLSSLYTAQDGHEEAEKEPEETPMTAPVWMMEQSRTAFRVTTAWSASNTIKRTPLRLENLADDVQVQLLSFLPLKDVRSLMATNRRYRKLLFTRDAQNLWKHWCSHHDWPQLVQLDNNTREVIVVDDLSLPTAARPSSSSSSSSSDCGRMILSPWHQQANLSLLLSMAQSQPTEIDHAQLNKYQSWKYANISSSSRRRRSRHRLFTTDGRDAPLLQYQLHEDQWIVQFTGRVGQGDRCVRANQALPRPTLMKKKEWQVPPPSHYAHKLMNISGNRQSDYNHLANGSNSNSSHGSLLDLFCRSTRAVTPPRPAFRPFVAPFVTQNATTVHLTPRFVSYFEVSIMEPTSSTTTTTVDENGNVVDRPLPPRDANAKDCVAVGLATETFDWQTRMPGWDAASFGYHGDDGGIFHSSGGMLREFGPSFGRGDVVGCGVDHVMRGIFYTLNGRFLGYAWTDLPLDMLSAPLYPVVGIDTNDYIHCNFGTQPFQYDLTAMVVRHEEFVHQSLSVTN